MLVLGIESTCDETACAVVRNGKEILSNAIYSQIDIQSPFGGVVPELACRKHVEAMLPCIDLALKEAKVTLNDIDLIAFANGPGLVGALLLGVNTAKALSLALQKPLISVNHIHAHLYAAFMSQEKELQFPCLGVCLSGGHTSILLMKSLTEFETVARTIDDAIGEAFDKVAKMLSLPYPGGPVIENLGGKGDPLSYPFKAGQMKDQPLNFSFSGLKTAVLYSIKDKIITEEDRKNIAASFQRAAFTDVIKKVNKAAEMYQCTTCLFGGGVTNSQTLREMFKENSSHLNLVFPSLGLSLDNGAMIAGFGCHLYKYQARGDHFSIQPFTR